MIFWQDDEMQLLGDGCDFEWNGSCCRELSRRGGLKGFPVMANDTANTNEPPVIYNHICFVVHGMGKPALDKFDDNVHMLDQTTKHVLAEEFPGKTAAVKWIPIKWYHLLHQLETVDERMNLITLPTCQMLRTVCNEILADVLYYFTSFHGQKVLKIVAQVINDAYAAFMEQVPTFDGTISIFGHSLGGVICYDLLSNQEQALAETPGRHFPQVDTHYPIHYPTLAFTPKHFFALGSPIGAVLIMRGQSLKDYGPPDTIRFFNVFSLYDPIAYRVEPLLNPRYTEISPVLWEKPCAPTMSYKLAYYQEMISAHLPDLGLVKSISDFSNSFPLPGIPTLSLPVFPILQQAELTIRTQISALSTTFSFHTNSPANTPAKRHHTDNDEYDPETLSSHVSKKLRKDKKSDERIVKKPVTRLSRRKPELPAKSPEFGLAVEKKDGLSVPSADLSNFGLAGEKKDKLSLPTGDLPKFGIDVEKRDGVSVPTADLSKFGLDVEKMDGQSVPISDAVKAEAFLAQQSTEAPAIEAPVWGLDGDTSCTDEALVAEVMASKVPPIQPSGDTPATKSSDWGTNSDPRSIGETLTAKLIALAAKAEEALVDESDMDIDQKEPSATKRKSLTAFERKDFFLNTATLDNHIHQVPLSNRSISLEFAHILDIGTARICTTIFSRYFLEKSRSFINYMHSLIA